MGRVYVCIGLLGDMPQIQSVLEIYLYVYVYFFCVNNELIYQRHTAQWLRCCATNRKVAGSIPAGVSGFFVDIKSFRSHYGPGVDSTSNRNEYQEDFLG